MKNPRKFYFHTLGCRSNYADTVDLQVAVAENGGQTVSKPSEADVVVLNTCSVTDAADKEALKLLRRYRTLAPEASLLVTGCFAETGGDFLQKEGLADAVIGPGRRSQILGALFDSGNEESENGNGTEDGSVQRRRSRRALPARWSESLDLALSDSVSGPGGTLGALKFRARYHLRIQEGCDNACTFCIIPFTRGGLVSRPAELIYADLRALEAKGYQEVVLSGTHIGGYGKDCGTSLEELLRGITGLGLRLRVRLSSIDPHEVSPEIVNILANNPIFCEHLHICVQALTDRLLKKMNRCYNFAQVEKLLELVAKRLPNCGIGADVITGFPGESREELNLQMERFCDLPFSYLHVFPYSERSHTAAVNLPGSVPVGERKRRSARWRSISSRKRKTFARKALGKRLEVVVEQITGGLARGTSREYLPVSVFGSAGELSSGERIFAKALAYEESEERLRCEL